MHWFVNLRHGMVSFLLALVAGCGSPHVNPPAAGTSRDALPGAPTATNSTTDVDPTDAAAATNVGNATPADPLDEIKEFAFALLHLRRMSLLQDREVQADLQLSPAQVQLFTAEGNYVDEQMKVFQQIPQEDREAKIKTEFVPTAQRYQTLIDRELNASQQKKLLDRVVRTQRGAIALLLPGVPESLQYTEAQRAAIGNIIRDNRKNMRIGNINNPVEILRLMQHAQASRDNAEKQLTPEQRQKWNAMLGK